MNFADGFKNWMDQYSLFICSGSGPYANCCDCPKRKKDSATKALAGNSCCPDPEILHYLLFINQWLKPNSILMDLGAVCWLSISPLLYFYCRALVNARLRWRWSLLWYFPFMPLTGRTLRWSGQRFFYSWILPGQRWWSTISCCRNFFTPKSI